MAKPFSRREYLKMQSAALLNFGLLPSMLRAGSAGSSSSPGFGKARSVILVFLQGGPSHLDLWDPKDDVPDDVLAPFVTDLEERADDERVLRLRRAIAGTLTHQRVAGGGDTGGVFSS